jgi:hypothetical protein
MFNIGNPASQQGRMPLQDPPIARFLYQSSAAGWLGLIVSLLSAISFLPAAGASSVAASGSTEAAARFCPTGRTREHPRGGPHPGRLRRPCGHRWFPAERRVPAGGHDEHQPVLAVLGILLILAWKNAGYLGLDRYLPALGTPWSQPKVEKPAAPAPRPAVAPVG